MSSALPISKSQSFTCMAGIPAMVRSKDSISPSPPFHSQSLPPSSIVVVRCVSVSTTTSAYTSLALPRSMLSSSLAANTVTSTIRRCGTGGSGNHCAATKIFDFFLRERVLSLLRNVTISSLYHASVGNAPAAISNLPLPISSSASKSSSKHRTLMRCGGVMQSKSNVSPLPSPQHAFAPPSTAVDVRTMVPSTSICTYGSVAPNVSIFGRSCARRMVTRSRRIGGKRGPMSVANTVELPDESSHCTLTQAGECASNTVASCNVSSVCLANTASPGFQLLGSQLCIRT